ncbi:aldo/keto reductase [Gilvimarinus sp. DA14]|uniref:aldo/keto reductase n=1 Tax=Gilvimarinus sp. DA14 TaxID=2956798 RepID=UPI0020B7EC98|nr:aldo/keto reductase [Gilvimarinus sp. DA14]UTF59157.1 aldo/keto reductase [Gilvimarinus sp. DA14]
MANTCVYLPPFAMGAAPLGNLYREVAEQQAQQAVHSALALGFNYIDTAPHYGFGLSERRLGRALSGAKQPVLSTKVGRVLEPIAAAERAPLRFGFAATPDLKPVFDYSYGGVMRSFNESLQRLSVERVELVFAHDLGELTHAEQHEQRWREFCEGGMRALEELKAAGRIGAIGLGVNEVAVCERALDELAVDVFLLAGRYTLLEQTPLDSLLPRCAQAGVSVIAAGPFNSGILAADLTADVLHYNYAPAPEAIVQKVRQLRSVCDDYAVPVQAAALQFPAAHPQVVSVLAGFASAAEVEQARVWIDTDIPASFWRALKAGGLLHPQAPVPSE